MKNLFLLVALLLVFIKSGYSTHVVGAEMTYRHVSGNTFEFTLKVFRDCGGVSVQDKFTIDYYSFSCKQQGRFTVNLVKKEEVGICSTEPSNCQGGKNPGIEMYEFKGNVTLAALCSDWIFSWQECNRNSSINNIEKPSEQCLYIEAKLNNAVAPTNNSPVFKNLPVAFLNPYVLNSINPGTIDPDMDQLVYKTITPKTDQTTFVTYKPPFSASNPISSNPAFSINSGNGNIEITPTKEEISITAIVVEEYRGGILVGSVMRDIQLISKDYSNSNPVISAIDGTDSRTFYICANDSACFTFSATDPEVTQNVSLSWNQGIDSSYFFVSGTPKKPEGKFCWRPKNNNAGTHRFTVTATDDFCPIGQATVAFDVVVIESPVVTFPFYDTTISCNDLINLSANVSKGLPPYAYEWKSGETTSSVSKGSGKYTLTVTDSKQCKGVDSVEVLTEITADFEFTRSCAEQSISFTDKSISETGTIIKWNWDFGDSTSTSDFSDQKNPSYIYPEEGVYLVVLEVEDDKGCRATVTKEVKVCDRPKIEFIIADSCRFNDLNILDESSVTTCGLKLIEATITNGKYTLSAFEAFPNPLRPNEYYYPPSEPYRGLTFKAEALKDTGWHTITYRIVNEYNCEETLTKNIYLHDNPYFRIPEQGKYFECNNPDYVLHAVDLKPGTHPLTLRWSNGSNLDSLVVDTIGIFSATLSDMNGCDTTIYRTIADPIMANFHTQLYCKDSNATIFIPSSVSAWGIKEYEWNMGDNSPLRYNTNPTQFPYKYSQDGIYLITLKVTDNKDCVDSISRYVNQTLPNLNYSISPTEICQGEKIDLISPIGKYIDTIIWDFGNGQRWQRDSSTLSRNANGEAFFNGSYYYPNGSAGQTFELTGKVYYNRINYPDTISCEYSIGPANIEVFEQLAVDVTIEGNCAYAPTVVTASQTSGAPATEWKWYYYYQDPQPHYHDDGTIHIHPIEKVDSAFTQNDSKTFIYGGNYFAELHAINSDGCKLPVVRHPFPIIKIDTPAVCPISVQCENRMSYYSFNLCTSFGEVGLDSVVWNFGDPASGNDNILVSKPGRHLYKNPGEYIVKVELFNTAYGCKNEMTDTVKVWALPEPEFTVSDPVCQGYPIYFSDNSSAGPDDPIHYWNWAFGDGDSAFAADTFHVYKEPGVYEVTYFVENSVSGCSDTIRKEVVVYENPRAGFSYVENELLYGKPIKFYDESFGAVKWMYIFGDGDSIIIDDPLHASPEHTYQGVIPKAVIQQIVYNQYGCSDTAVKVLDLNPYLLLPNAFSPNQDGNNDGLYLIYKGIEELLEFRVYNRWGELVFDAHGNLDAIWDGTYKGREQPLGTYVYYIKGRTFLQDEITQSGKVTLIR